MKFTETDLKGAYLIDLEPIYDERGFFSRLWDQKDFKKMGLSDNFVQMNLSYNRLVGTVRGMHFQVSPPEETKIVSCISGSMFDVIIDLREESPTYLKWCGIQLSSFYHQSLFIPSGIAHGFQTLDKDTEVLYQVSAFFSEFNYRGVRWNDPAFSIKWPLPISVISSKDSSYPDFDAKRLK